MMNEAEHWQTTNGQDQSIIIAEVLIIEQVQLNTSFSSSLYSGTDIAGSRYISQRIVECQMLDF